MQKKLLIFLSAFILTNGICIAQTGIPQFKSYKVEAEYTGKCAPLILSKNDKIFRTGLRDAAKNNKANFAGHYILTAWGCGAECLIGAAIDMKTGKVYFFPFTICCWFDRENKPDDKFDPLEFRLNSNLIVFSGVRNEEGANGAHFYEFRDGKFMLIKSIEAK